MAVQIPDEVQAHRRHRTSNLPSSLRSVQSRVLVNIPVSRGNGRGISADEETLGPRNGTRGQLYHFYPRTRTGLCHKHYQAPVSQTSSTQRRPSRPKQAVAHKSRQRYRQAERSPSLSSPSESEHRAYSSPRTPSTRSRSPQGRRSTSSPSPTASPTVTSPSSPTLFRAHDYNPATDVCCFGLIPRRWFRCKARGSAQIDVFARIAFPAMFILFNLAYWSTYMVRKEDKITN